MLCSVVQYQKDWSDLYPIWMLEDPEARIIPYANCATTRFLELENPETC